MSKHHIYTYNICHSSYLFVETKKTYIERREKDNITILNPLLFRGDLINNNVTTIDEANESILFTAPIETATSATPEALSMPVDLISSEILKLDA